MRAIFLAIGLILAGPISAQEAIDRVPPEGPGAGVMQVPAMLSASAEAKAAGRPVGAENWMIAAANPLAVEAGAKILARGGTAADAMIAVQAVLGLVEPQSSGLGGGAFLVWHDAASGEITTLDGRETAPLGVTPQLFLDADGAPLDFFEAVIGGRSVGVPGVPALMERRMPAGGAVTGPVFSPMRSGWPKTASPSARGWRCWWPVMPSGWGGTQRPATTFCPGDSLCRRARPCEIRPMQGRLA